ncbi:MAG: 50S ribosomal protein L13 [bacterium]|nr:50S ribosomal protein L13 [bacterium]
MEEHTIDAEGKKIGRVASEAAAMLMGKNRADFARNVVHAVKVKIINTSKVVANEKKRESKAYVRYSGYPGGIKEERLGHLIGRRGYGEVFRRAVFGMLPKNKLRSQIIKNLTLTD